MPRKAENQQADRHQHRHDSGLGDDSCKVTNQQVGHRIERTGDVLFVFFRKHDDHHVVKESALLEEEKGDERNRKNRDQQTSDSSDDRRKEVVDQIDVQQRPDLSGNRVGQRELVVRNRKNLFDHVLQRYQRPLERSDDLGYVQRRKLIELLEQDRNKEPEEAHDNQPNDNQCQQCRDSLGNPDFRTAQVQARQQVGQRFSDDRQYGSDQDVRDDIAEIPNQEHDHRRDHRCHDITLQFGHVQMYEKKRSLFRER